MGKHSNLKMLTYYIPTQMIIYDKKGICLSIHHYKIAHS